MKILYKLFNSSNMKKLTMIFICAWVLTKWHFLKNADDQIPHIRRGSHHCEYADICAGLIFLKKQTRNFETWKASNWYEDIHAHEDLPPMRKCKWESFAFKWFLTGVKISSLRNADEQLSHLNGLWPMWRIWSQTKLDFNQMVRSRIHF